MSQTKAQLISDLVQALNFTGTSSAPANGVYLSAANTIKLATASTERLKIDGTELVVNDTGASVDFRVEGDTDANLLFVDASADKVGIGTSSPNYLLDVEATSGDSQIRLSSVGTGSSDDTLLRLQIGGTSANNYIYFGDNDDSNAGQIRYSHASNFFSLHVNAAERLRIDSSGKVGIGTTSPTNQFHVYDSAAANDTPEIKIEAFRPAIRFKDRSSSSVSAEIVGDNSLKFRVSTPVDDSTALTERMCIDDSGKVGIGTTSPAALLDVVNTGGAAEIICKSSTQPRLMLKTSGTTAECRVDFGDSGDSSRGAIGYNHSDDALKFYTTGVANERMRIRSDGKISIGTSINVTNSYEFSLTGADATGGFYAHGRNHYLSNRSDAYASLTLKKSNADSDAIDYLQIRDSGNNLKSQITGAGNWKPIAGGGIDFSAHGNAAGMTSELLDDYEEGTWTPTMATNAGGNLTTTYTIQTGTYTKIGRMVYVLFDMTVSSTPTGTAGYPQVRGLPFTPWVGQNNAAGGGFPIPSFRDSNAMPVDARLYNCSYGHSSDNAIWIQYFNSSGAIQQPAGGTWWSSGRCQGEMVYQTTA